MADLQILKDELDDDPDGRGYSGMTATDAAIDLRIKRKVRNKKLMTGVEAYDLTDPTEYSALSDIAKDRWLALCAIDELDPFGPAAQVVIDIFPPAGTTIGNLQNARVETVSQGVFIGFGNVATGDVEQARAL